MVISEKNICDASLVLATCMKNLTDVLLHVSLFNTNARREDLDLQISCVESVQRDLRTVCEMLEVEGD